MFCRSAILMAVLFILVAWTTEDENEGPHKISINSAKVQLINKPDNEQAERQSRSSAKFYALKNKKKSGYDYSSSPGLFSAIISILGGSVVDTFTAYRNVSRIVQSAFPSRTPEGTQNGTTFTIGQTLRLFGRNFRGLRRIFDKEFARALNESDRNVAEFSKELKESIRPFLQPNRNITAG